MASKNNPSARIKPKVDETTHQIDAAKNSDINRIVSLNGGKYAYLRCPLTLQTNRYSTANPAFLAALLELAGKGMEARIRMELTNLAKSYFSWDAVLVTFNGLTEPVAA